MKKNKSRAAIILGVTAALLAFTLLSIFGFGLVQFSRDVGIMRWLMSTASYAIFNKFAFKLIFCAVLGGMVYFVSAVSLYQNSMKKNLRYRHEFPSESTQVPEEKTA